MKKKNWCSIKHSEEIHNGDRNTGKNKLKK